MHTLKSVRVFAGKTQEEWAEICGVSKTTICNWETGKGFPGLSELHRMSQSSGIPIEDIKVDLGSVELKTLNKMSKVSGIPVESVFSEIGSTEMNGD